MKPQTVPQQTLPLLKPVKNNLYSAKKVVSINTVPPPDEETLRRHNAIVKQYPFCNLLPRKKERPALVAKRF